MKRIIFLLAAVAISFTCHAQKIADKAPSTLEGETVYLVIDNGKIANQVLDYCGNTFAKADLKVLSVTDYYQQVKSGEGYVIVPVKENVGDKANCWLTLYKSSEKAVIKKPDASGLFAKDPALPPIAEYLIDQSKLKSIYAGLYVRSLELLITQIGPMSPEKREAKLTSNTLVGEFEVLMLDSKDVQPEFNQPTKIADIHHAATISDFTGIQRRIAKKEGMVGIVEMMAEFDESGSHNYIRIYSGSGSIAKLKEVETTDGLPLINRAILEGLKTEAQLKSAAGK